MSLTKGFSLGIETLTLSPLRTLENLGQLWKISMLARKKSLVGQKTYRKLSLDWIYPNSCKCL